MRRGFTLMEILAAVSVLAIMAALIFGVMTSLFTIAEDTDDLVSTNHMGRVAMERMARDLAQAFLSMNFGETETTRTIFDGERDRVLFTYLGNVPVKAGAFETDQGVVEYRLGRSSKDRAGNDLIRRFKRLIDEDPEDGGEEGLLATGVKELRFEYWDEFEEDWQDSWTADDCLSTTEPGFRLPNRVRIALELYDQRDLTYVFETQTSIYVNNPLMHGQPITPKQKECFAAQQLLRQQRDAAAALGGLGGALKSGLEALSP